MKALAERVLNAELDHQLETGEPDGRASGRNRGAAKTVLTGTGKPDLQVRAIGSRPSARSSSPSTSAASRASTTRSSRCKLRRAVRGRGYFLTEDAVLKLLLLVLNLAAKAWMTPAREWTAAKAQFAILFENRFAIT